MNYKTFSWIVVGLLVSPFLLVAAPTFIPGFDALIVKSGSMEPSIPVGAVVYVQTSVDPDSIKENDVITFRSGVESNPKLTTHRVIDVVESDQRTSFRTKGDANEDSDPELVGEERVYGKQLFSIPYIGYLINYGSTTNGFVAFMLVPATLIIIGELINIWKQVDSNAGKTSVALGLSIVAIIGLGSVFLFLRFGRAVSNMLTVSYNGLMVAAVAFLILAIVVVQLVWKDS